MKQINKIVGILFFTLVYCAAILHVNDVNASYVHNSSSDSVSSNIKQIDFVSANQGCIDFSINQLTPETIEVKTNSSYPQFYAAVFQPEKHFLSAINNYASRSELRTIRFRKNDSIFPFHYHW